MRKRKHNAITHAPQAEVPAVVDTEAPIPLCHNIVSTTQIQCKERIDIDLQRLAMLFPCSTYDRKRFAAITIRLSAPQCTCLLFGSGKLVITGSTCYHACIMAAHTVSSMLRTAMPDKDFRVRSCTIQNIVAHVELQRGHTIDLPALYARFCECATYQKAIFPGLVLRLPGAPIVVLVFSSGRIVCTGGRSYEDIQHGFASIYQVLKQHIVRSSST